MCARGSKNIMSRLVFPRASCMLHGYPRSSRGPRPMTTRAVCALFWQAAAILVIALSGFQPQAAAQQLSMDQLTKNVWKRTFNISDAQANDPVWLAQDDDGDGITNGAELIAGTDPESRGSTLQITNT